MTNTAGERVDMDLSLKGFDRIVDSIEKRFEIKDPGSLYWRHAKIAITHDYSIDDEAEWLAGRCPQGTKDGLDRTYSLGYEGVGFRDTLQQLSGFDVSDLIDGKHGREIFGHRLFMDYYLLWDSGRRDGRTAKLGSKKAEVRERYDSMGLGHLYGNLMPATLQGKEACSRDEIFDQGPSIFEDWTPEFMADWRQWRTLHKLNRNYPFWIAMPSCVMMDDMYLIGQAEGGIRGEFANFDRMHWWSRDSFTHDVSPDINFAFIVYSHVRDKDTLHKLIGYSHLSSMYVKEKKQQAYQYHLVRASVACAALGDKGMLDCYAEELEIIRPGLVESLTKLYHVSET